MRLILRSNVMGEFMTEQMKTTLFQAVVANANQMPDAELRKAFPEVTSEELQGLWNSQELVLVNGNWVVMDWAKWIQTPAPNARQQRIAQAARTNPKRNVLRYHS